MLTLVHALGKSLPIVHQLVTCCVLGYAGYYSMYSYPLYLRERAYSRT